MKENLSRMWRSGLALLMALCLIVGMVPSVAFAAEVSDVNDDGVINYVSLGASNVNGYGMRGYLDNELYEYPLLKEQANIYGYEQDTPGSYPVLIKEYLEGLGNEDVELSQLAISSMRAEEVRFLLDDSYAGDAYTDWRFCDVEGYPNRSSQNWFYLAGKLEWEERGNSVTPSQEQAVKTLKEAYREAIADADLITVDIGINNFGVYASNQIVSNMYENDMNTIDPELAEIYAEGKAYVMTLLNEYAGDSLDVIPMHMLEHMADTMAYALVGFCLSFDAVMEQIETLNPDATVVVVSIQNLMHGLNATLPGVDVELPFGDLFGALINAANVYTATVSPYCDSYIYADVRQNGHVEFFSDELLGYNGDPSTLSQDMKDCFDVYDNDLHIKTRVQQFFVSALYEKLGSVKITKEQEEDLEAFYEGTVDESITIAGTPVLKFLADGEEGNLSETMAPYYAIYEKALITAYDVMAEIMQAGLELDTLDATSFGQNFGPVEDALMGAFFGVLEDAVGASVGNPDYSFDLDVIYPDGIFKTLAAGGELSEGFVNTVAAMGIRTGIGNSFYGHPNGNGHEELKTKILDAIEADTTGKEVVSEEIMKALEDLSELIEEYGPEAIEQAYAYAVENGYVDQLNAAIEELKTELEAKAEQLAQEIKPVIEAKVAEMKAQVEALEENLTELKAALEAKKAELEALVGEATEDVEAAIEAIEKAIADIEATIETVKAQIEVLNEAIEELVDVLADIDTELENLSDAITSLEDAAAALIEALANGGNETVESVIAAVKAAREAVLTAAEAVKAVYETVSGLVEQAVELAEALGIDVDAVAEKVNALLENICENVSEDVAAVVEEAIDAIEAELEAAVAELTAAAEAKIAELEAQIAEKKAELEAAAEELKAEIEAEIAELETQIEAVKAELEQKLAEIKAEAEAKAEELKTAAAELVEEVEAAVEEAVAQIEAQVEAAIEVAAAAAEELIAAAEELAAELVAEAEELINEVVAAVEAAYTAATTDDYTVTDDSYYVALGDSSAVSESYVDQLAAELEIDYTNLAAEGTIVDAPAIIGANAAEIAKADLITIGYGNATFAQSALDTMLDALMTGSAVEYDWASLVTEEGVSYVEQALDEVYENLVAEGMDVTVPGLNGTTLATAMTMAVEAYAYNAMVYAMYLPEVVNAVHEINPEALIIIVGMSNPFQGTVIEYNGVSIDLGEYAGYLVDAANVHGTAYAMLTGNAIYVAAPDAESKVTGATLGLNELLAMYYGASDCEPTANGHTYIKNQILNALNITVEETGLLGDANSDGIVDSYDAFLIAEYDVGNITSASLDLSVSDVSGDGIVDSYDAFLIAEYDVGNITVFPAAG